MDNKHYLEKMKEDAIAELKEPGVREKLYSLRTGDRVRLRQDMAYAKLFEGDEGTATITWLMVEFDPIVNHGAVEVKFDNGVIEHFCHWKWWESLERVDED